MQKFGSQSLGSLLKYFNIRITSFRMKKRMNSPLLSWQSDSGFQREFSASAPLRFPSPARSSPGNQRTSAIFCLCTSRSSFCSEQTQISPCTAVVYTHSELCFNVDQFHITHLDLPTTAARSLSRVLLFRHPQLYPLTQRQPSLSLSFLCLCVWALVLISPAPGSTLTNITYTNIITCHCRTLPRCSCVSSCQASLSGGDPVLIFEMWLG